MKNTNVTLGIRRVPYSQMMKSEMADFVEKTLNIVDNQQLNSELIAPMYNLLLEEEPNIKLLRLSYGIDQERLKVNKLKGELMLTISTLKLKVRLLSKSKSDPDLEMIQNSINTHLRYLDKSRNDKQLTQKVAGFTDMTRANLEFGEALSEHSLVEEVDAIASAFSRFERARYARIRKLSERPEISTQKIIRDMAVAVDNLFKGIEVAHLISINTVAEGVEGEEGEEPIDYVPLIEELDQLTEMYRRSISLRLASNKRKAQEEEDAKKDEDAMDGESTQAPDGESGGDDGSSHNEDPSTDAEFMAFCHQDYNSPLDEEDFDEELGDSGVPV